MRKINNILFYNSIKEMPIIRYNEMQNYLLQLTGIGNGVGNIDEHLNNIEIHLSSENVDNAKKELINLRINLFSIVNKIDFKSMAFACLIKSINGKELGHSEAELQSALEHVNKLTVEQVEDMLFDLKKNFIQN